MRLGRALLAAGLVVATACAGDDPPDSATSSPSPAVTVEPAITEPATPEPTTPEPTATEPTIPPPSTTSLPDRSVPATWFRYGAEGLSLVSADGEQRLIDEPVGWAASDGAGGVLLTIWGPDRFGPTWWLAGGATQPVELSEWDAPLVAARLDGRPVAVDGWPTPECDEVTAGQMSALDLITRETTTLQCGTDGPDSGSAPDAFGGGLYVGVAWDAVHPSGRSTAIRLVFRDEAGDVVELATNPFSGDCSPCELTAALSPDGTRLAVLHRADAPPTRSDEYEAWLASTSTIETELLVVDLVTGEVLFEETLPAGATATRGSWFDGRYVALAPDVLAFPRLARGDTGDPVRTLQRLLVERGADIEIDGVFGPGTEEAVAAFHADRFGAARVAVGPDTWAELGIPSTLLDTTTGATTEVPGRLALDVVVLDGPAPGVPFEPAKVDVLALLRPDGLGPFQVGDDADVVQAWLVEQLGDPDTAVVEPGEGGWPMPSCTERRFSYWAAAGLTVGFTDAPACGRTPALAGWFVVDEGPPWFAPDHGEAPIAPIDLHLVTTAGVGLASTVGDLRAAEPDVTFGEWDVDGYLPAVFRTSDGLHGRVDWNPTVEVELALDELGVALAEFQSSNRIDEDGIGPRTLAALGVSVPDEAPIVYLSAGSWDWGF